jgi:hypothetical protein
VHACAPCACVAVLNRVTHVYVGVPPLETDSSEFGRAITAKCGGPSELLEMAWWKYMLLGLVDCEANFLFTLGSSSSESL